MISQLNKWAHEFMFISVDIAEFLERLLVFVVVNVPIVWWNVGIWSWSVYLAAITCKHENNSNLSVWSWWIAALHQKGAAIDRG